MKTYLVGGAVRDHLLGLPVTERDWVVIGYTPEKMIAEGYLPVGKDFPVFLHPKSHEEYALARTERKSGRGYQGFTFYSAEDVTLEQDLIRRDLTINAIAMDNNGNLIDPFHGVTDLQNKILRHVSEAFIEDPVRILRIARFYARFYPYGFSIAPETIMLMRKMVCNDEVAHLVSERVWQETQRALCEESPEKFFECLRMCGALKIIFPELDALYGVPNPPNWHPEIDSGVHNMMVLQQAAKLSKDPEVRFAALLHDVGKALTPANEWPKHHGHEEHGVATTKTFCERLRVPKSYSDLAVLVTHYHGLVHKIAGELNATTIVKLFEKLDAFRRPERFLQFVLACEADARGRPGFENAEYPQRDFILKALHIVAAVEVSEIIQKGFTGKEIATRLHEARVNALKKFLEN